MKKLLSLMLTLAMLFSCCGTAISRGEEAAAPLQAEGLTPREQEIENALSWLMEQVPEEEMLGIFSWDKDTVREKLEGYDGTLEHLTREELVEEISGALGQLSYLGDLYSSLNAMTENAGTESETAGDGEDGADLSGLLGLFGGLLGGEGTEGEEAGAGLSGLLGLFGGLTEGAEESSEWTGEEDQDYEIETIFNNTYWESGELEMVSVWQDGYYKVAIQDGDTELSYLCTAGDYVDEAEQVQFSVLRGIGAGDEETTAAQADHGEGTFLYDWRTDEIIWTKPDGTRTVFTHIIDPLDNSQWYTPGKTMTIVWGGEQHYQVSIEAGVGEFTSWQYDCELQEDGSTLKGVGSKISYGSTEYADGEATFAVQEHSLVWTDSREEDAAEGLTLEEVDGSLVYSTWFSPESDSLSASILFVDGYYDVSVYNGQQTHSYLCTLDWDTGILTAVDPATIPFDSLSLYLDREAYTSTGTFVLQERQKMVWQDDTGLAGDGITLEHI